MRFFLKTRMGARLYEFFFLRSGIISSDLKHCRVLPVYIGTRAEKCYGKRNMKSVSYVHMSESGYNSRPVTSGQGKPNQMESTAQVTDVALADKSDEVLITLFQQGERDAFRVLVDRYHGRIKNLIFSIFHESGVIDDLAQEVFIKAYEALPRFRFQSSFYTWLYRIAVNRSRDELRKRKVRRFFSLQSMMESREVEESPTFAVEPGDNEMQEIIAKGLQSLPEKFRVAIILKDIDGLSYEEMAEVMECEIGTVKSRLSRARAMLREVLKPFLKEL